MCEQIEDHANDINDGDATFKGIPYLIEHYVKLL